MHLMVFWLLLAMLIGGASRFLLDGATATDLMFAICQLDWTAAILTMKIGNMPKNYF